MFYVYVLLNPQKGQTYIGYTKDLIRRVKEHQQEKGARYTRRGVWNLVYYEAYAEQRDAALRERRLKQDGRSKTQLLRRIQNSLTGQKGAGEAPN